MRSVLCTHVIGRANRASLAPCRGHSDDTIANVVHVGQSRHTKQQPENKCRVESTSWTTHEEQECTKSLDQSTAKTVRLEIDATGRAKLHKLQETASVPTTTELSSIKKSQCVPPYHWGCLHY